MSKKWKSRGFLLERARKGIFFRIKEIPIQSCNDAAVIITHSRQYWKINFTVSNSFTLCMNEESVNCCPVKTFKSNYNCIISLFKIVTRCVYSYDLSPLCQRFLVIFWRLLVQLGKSLWVWPTNNEIYTTFPLPTAREGKIRLDGCIQGLNFVVGAAVIIFIAEEP